MKLSYKKVSFGDTKYIKAKWLTCELSYMLYELIVWYDFLLIENCSAGLSLNML